MKWANGEKEECKKHTHTEGKKHAKGGKNLHTRYQFVRGTIGIYVYALAWPGQATPFWRVPAIKNNKHP